MIRPILIPALLAAGALAPGRAVSAGPQSVRPSGGVPGFPRAGGRSAADAARRAAEEDPAAR